MFSYLVLGTNNKETQKMESRNYQGYFPSTLFLCHDDCQSMHFILSLKHMSENQQKSLEELMQYCGAVISSNVEDATDYSVIIVDHNEIVNFKAPAFTVTYLEDCLEKMKIQPIHNYRQDVTRHIAKDDQCMNVVYYRNQSWNSLLTKTEKNWFDINANTSISDDFCEPLAASSCVDFLSLPHSRLESNKDNDESKTINKEINGLELSGDEDSDIEDVNLQVNEEKTFKGTKDNCAIRKGKSENTETTNESKSRALDTTQKDGTSHPKKNKNISSGSRSTESTPLTSVPGSSKWSFLDDFQSGSEDEVFPSKTEVKRKKMNNFFDFEAANEDLYRPNKDKKHSRMPYSYEEQSNILKYIIDHCEYPRIKGRELWMVMERRKVCPNRTWQSMKEHFVKKIVLNLESFDFLTESNKMKIKSFSC